MADEQFGTEEREQLSRRQVIRRGMVVAGLGAWSAPIIGVALRHARGEGSDSENNTEVVPAQRGQTSSCGGMGSGDPCLPERTVCGTYIAPGGLFRECVCLNDAVTGECGCYSRPIEDCTTRPCPTGSTCVRARSPSGEIFGTCFRPCIEVP